MKKIAVVSIIIHDRACVATVNELLHEACEDILGRMGLPIKSRGISIISIIIETENEKFTTLIEKLQTLSEVQVQFIEA